jgi:hypothetical protein
VGEVVKHFPAYRIVSIPKRMLDNMHIATTINHSDALIVPGLRQLVTPLALIFATLHLLFFDSSAHAQVVEYALEPTFASFESSTKINVEHASEQSDKMESVGRKAGAKTNAQSYIPPQRPIGQVNIDSRPKPKNGNNALPENIVDAATQTAAVHASTSDQMQGELYYPKSRNHDEIFAYQPLYFEEVNLERYGRTCGHLQPVASSLRFFATIPMLPYAMTVSHPCTAYTQKWPYGAGWGAPKVREFEPVQLKPSLVQVGAITGLVFVLP